MAGVRALQNIPPEVRGKLRKTGQPEWFAPMLATLTDEPFSPEGWIFEPKFDGERCLVFHREAGTKLS